jgi:putative copper export protein
MAESQYETAESTGDELFDRYTLPKIALTIILAASLVGTYLTLHLGGTESVLMVWAKWLYLVTIGILVGGLCWKHVFVRPGDLDEGTNTYCERMYSRFDRIAWLAVLGLGVTGGAVAYRYWQSLSEAIYGVTVTILLGTLLTVLVISLSRSQSVDDQFRSPLGLTAFALVLALLGATVNAEVALRGGSAGTLVVRTIHLLAFSIWLGGAVWNIFVAVPTGQESPTVPVVSAAGEQLERFRWAVRFIIPTIIATGLYQAYTVLGASIDTYLGSVLGIAVVAKLGFIGTLVLIFKLCPMWRACSPIEGVCDLEDLGESGSPSSEVSNDD